MLRAGFLAFAAFDAFGSFRFPAPGMYHIVIVIRIPVMVNLLCVHNRKQIRNRNALWTAGLTVASGRAWDQVHGTENLLHPAYCLHFFLRQRFKVLHIADIVLHLRHITHTGKNYHNSFKTGSKPDCITSWASAMQFL